MKRTTARIIAMLLCAVLCTAWLPAAAADSSVFYLKNESGTCGDNLNWTLDGRGILTISGTGPMYDYNDTDKQAPWKDDRFLITTLVIKEGVTHIGNAAFYNCGRIGSVWLPDTLADIGEKAFHTCSGLASLTIPEGLSAIGERAFAYCGILDSLYFLGDAPSFGANTFEMAAIAPGVSVRMFYREDRNWPEAVMQKYGGNVTWLTYAPILFTKQPTDQMVPAGKKVHFKVEAEGNELSYQWYSLAPGSRIWKYIKSSAGKKADYSFKVKESQTGYLYRCEISDGNRIVSTPPVRLSVGESITIVKQPIDVEVKAGHKATLYIEAEGEGLSYQWYYLVPGTEKWNRCKSASSRTDTYTLTAKKEYNGYIYHCIISNDQYSVTSDEITLSVN